MTQFYPAHPVIWIWGTGLLFGIIHSLLATRVCKAGWYAIGLSPRAYRLIYSCIAVFLTIVWIAFVHLLPDQPLYHLQGIPRLLGYGVQLAGLWLFLAALRPIDVPAFLGLRSFPDTVEPFVEQGIYRYIRHPMYTGIMLIMFAMPGQTLNSMNLFLCISVYFIIGSKFEEARMCAAHPAYAAYMQRVPAFIPRFRMRQ